MILKPWLHSIITWGGSFKAWDAGASLWALGQDCTESAVPMADPWAASHFNSVWMEQTQNCPFFQPPSTLWLLFQWPPLETSQAILSPKTSQHGFSSLNPYCWRTVSFQIHLNYSTEVEATVNRLVSLHQRPPTPTSPRASTIVSTLTMWLWRACGTSSKRNVKVPSVSWRRKTSLAAIPSYRTCRSRPRWVG